MYTQHILNILAYLVLGSTADITSVVMSILYIAGLWGIFRKSGIEGWKALIPCVREAKLGCAAGLEREGRVAAFVQGIIILMRILTEITEISLTNAVQEPPDSVYNFMLFCDVVETLAALVLLIYLIRIAQSLCEVYGRKKAWLLLWIPLEFIPAMMWGWMKKYQPQWKPEEMHTDAAGFFSGSKAAVLGEGLTVNLEERTVTEFFKKKYLLRDIHMYIQPGHMVLLLGGSGAGKTTYLNAVNGYEKANAEVVLNGENLYKHYKQMQYDIGFVPQLDLMRGSDRC